MKVEVPLGRPQIQEPVLLLPPKGAVSTINLQPLDVVNRLGKYKLIYDYRVPSFLDNMLASSTMPIGRPSSVSKPTMVKEGGSNANQIYNFDGDGTGILTPLKPFVFKPTINPNPQVGAFSKGDIVNVIKFSQNDGFATIENPNYVEANPNLPKSTGFFSGADLKNSKELQIPKGYLSKVDDKTPITVKTGINFGANLNQQTIYPTYPTKPIQVEPTIYVEPKPYLVVESFELNNAQFQGTKQMGIQKIPISKGSVVFLPQKVMSDQYDLALQQGKLQELPIVSVVSLVDKQMGRCNTDGAIYEMTVYNPCRTVKKGETLTGYIANGVFANSNKDVIKPQLNFGEYKLIQTNEDSSVTVENTNNNLWIIAGAFVVGYFLFRKDKSE